MKLPNCEQAEVPDRKLTAYLLDANHPQNKGKADFYELAGYRKQNTDALKTALLELITLADVTKGIETGFGSRYVIGGRLPCPNGKSYPLRTVWFIPNGETIPKLVTAYPN
ncbi:MAG: hypothetical protein H7319_15230 [Spirosoma sp.]|nr:hypothetical protein [Spirosoma sp.]